MVEPEPADETLNDWFAQGMEAHQAGRLDAAVAHYQRILAAEPHNPDALHFLGLALHQGGNPEAGLVHLQRAVDLRPDVASFHLNMGGVLESQGQWPAARSAYENAVRLDPNVSDAHFNLGIALLELDQPVAAAARFEQVITLDPNDAQARCNLARAYAADGQLLDALAVFSATVSRAPRMVAAHAGLADVCRRLGRQADAEAALECALNLRPGDPALLNNLGNLLREDGRVTAAASAYRRALQVQDKDARIWLNLARAELGAGQAQPALAAVRRALTLAPDDAAARAQLASVLSVLRPERYDPGLDRDLEKVLLDSRIDPQPLARCLAVQVRLRCATSEDGPKATDIDALVGDTALMALLSRTVNVDAELEHWLKRLRQVLLQEVVAGRLPTQLCGAMALQCFANEYLWELGAPECAAAAQLRARFKARLVREGMGTRSDAFECELAALAMCEPLSALGLDSQLAVKTSSGSEGMFARMLRRCLLEPRQERDLRTEIAELDVDANRVSVAVRAQYEDNPYPRWVTPPQSPQETISASLWRRFGARLRMPAPGRIDDILVAGCGTGFEVVLLAASQPGARIVAMDLSLASLAYARRMTAQLGLEQVRFLRGDLLAAERLGQQFDLIISTGVLHHLDDPMAGWRALRRVMKADGLMRISLYSERARRAIVAVREQIAEAGISWGEEGLQMIRGKILRAPDGDPLAELARSDDLFSVSAVRDLLFHVCEHRFTPAQIALCLQELKLEFLGMETADPSIRTRFRAYHGAGADIAGLAAWDEFEQRNPRSFDAMLQFWCQADQ